MTILEVILGWLLLACLLAPFVGRMLGGKKED